MKIVKRLRRYVWNLLIAIDQVGNVLLFGYPDETISLRAARACGKAKQWGCVLCRLLNFIEEDHCEKTVESKLKSIAKRKY